MIPDIDGVAGALVEHRRIAIVLLLVVVLAVGSGVGQLEESSGLPEMDIGSEEEATLEEIDQRFTRAHDGETTAQIVVEDDNVLDRETLVRGLEMQREIRSDETVQPTLAEDAPTTGIATVVGTAAHRRQTGEEGEPMIDEQIAAIESLEDDELATLLEELLQEDADALAFLPNDYEPGTTTSDATMIVVVQTAGEGGNLGQASDRIVESQQAIEEIAANTADGERTLVVGNGIISGEMTQAQEDTFQILGPLALVFVLLTITLVYRKLTDVALSLVGILLVLLWTFGALGWLGIPFNALLIAVPVLLIGLSIDYGIHVFMRYREQRAETGDGPAPSMRAAIGSVGVALLWITVTTVVGFLSNVVSPARPIQQIGIISAIGIVGALVVFGGLIPLVKITVDGLFERVGLDTTRSAIGDGDGDGVVARVLSVGPRAARAAPLAVIVVTLLLTGVTTAAATGLSTSWGPEDHLPDEAPGWTENLPEQFAPGEYDAKENYHYVNDRFVRDESNVEILVEGGGADPATLHRIDEAQATAADQRTVERFGSGRAHVTSPLSVMHDVADRAPEFRETFEAADTDDDGVPDRDVAAVYDHLFEVAPDEAASIIERGDDGKYGALRVAVAVNPDADGERVTEEGRELAAVIEGGDTTARATGDPIVQQRSQQELLSTMLTSFFITLLAVVVLLAVVYRVLYGSATLGLVTLVPVVFTVSWIFATMYVLDYTLTTLAAIIASITIGIGIDYSIHVSERFRDELETLGNVDDAISRTVRGTGAALLASALTTGIGFGVLAFALHPQLQQFGLLTALMIFYAFLGSVVVLPSLLVAWARFVGPEAATTEEPDLGTTAET